MDKTKGKDLHKAVRNRGMVLIAIGTAVMGLAVFFLLHIYQNKNEEIFRTLIEENLTSTHQGQASDIRGIIRETGGLLEKLAEELGEDVADERTPLQKLRDAFN